MSVLLAALAAYFAFSIVLYLAMVCATLVYYRRGPEGGPVHPFTVIKPIRGADDDLEANLTSLPESDPEGRLQVIFAIESAEDPAYPVALRVAQRYPGRDIAVVLTGPSGERMGKAHNMIEALPRARHDGIVFSDADVAADRALVAETGRAFAAGLPAFYATPYFYDARGPGQALYAAAFNHGFSAAGALMHGAGLFRGYSGAWMGFTRDTLAKIGGLEPLERNAADDYFLGTAVRRAGIRIGLLRRLAELREPGASLGDAGRHFHKWAVVVRGAAFPVFAAAFVHSGVLFAFAALAAWTALGGEFWAAGLYLAGACCRVAAAALQDRVIAGRLLPALLYPLLPALDLGQFPFWLATLATDRFAWRGKSYRIVGDGRIEVLG